MPNAAHAGRLPAKKIGLLHVARKQLALEEDHYRAILWQHGGCDSSADLDLAGFNRVMRYLTALGFRSTWTRRTFGNRAHGMATPNQVELIRKLWREWSGNDDEHALGHWLERCYGVTALRFLDQERASKAINGLRAMAKRKRPAA